MTDGVLDLDLVPGIYGRGGEGFLTLTGILEPCLISGPMFPLNGMDDGYRSEFLGWFDLMSPEGHSFSSLAVVGGTGLGGGLEDASPFGQM